jgi:hypothetical protein
VRACATVNQFNDVDREETNGCECPRVPGVVDEPDVSPTYPTAQSPQSLGTRTRPFRTIREAIGAAVASATRKTILVAQGTYVEQVVLEAGLSLHGGYSSDFRRRDVVTFPTLIEAPEPDFQNPAYRRGTVNAQFTGGAPTLVAGFTIRGYDVTSRAPSGQPGFNSYAVYVALPGSLVLQNNHVVGGRGGDASPGLPGLAGANGGNGVDGLTSRECQTPNCSNETQAGGPGGQNVGCPGLTSGNPGGGADPRNNPQQYASGVGGNGQGGNNAQYDNSFGMQFNLCKYDCVVPPNGLNGGPAMNGGDGLTGAPGSGCLGGTGMVSGPDWTGGSAAPGVSGSPGRGGGGGGAGGCVTNTNSPMCTVGRRVGDLGATGGGGGAGGCGGGPGFGAGGGGGSFGVFVAQGSVRFLGNLIDLGFGGAGGTGGAGGYGGLGGQGGRGGPQNSAAWCAGQGGLGGRGGNGGAGSGGGGGCGGSVFGIAGRNVMGAQLSNTFGPTPLNAAGSPGVGGSSPAGAAFRGRDGQAGTVQQVVVF